MYRQGTYAIHIQLKYCRAVTNLYLKYYLTGIHRYPTPETTRRDATHPQPVKEDSIGRLVM